MIKFFKNMVKKPNKLHTINAADYELLSWLNLSEYGAIVAGGAARRWFQGHSVGTADVDIYFKNEEGLVNLTTHISTLSSPPNIFDPSSFTFGIINKSVKSLCNSQQAITYEFSGFRRDGSTIKVQLIKIKMYEDTHDLLNTFDISVATVATDGLKWIVGDHFLKDLEDNKLRMLKINKHSVKRLVKYWSYGYSPDDAQLQEIIDSDDVQWHFSMDSDKDYHDT